MAQSKNELLEESGFGTSSSYGAYNTYGEEGYESHQEKQVNPFATDAGYAYSPTRKPHNQLLETSQKVLLASAVSFMLAIGLSFASNAQTAVEFGHFDPSAAISAGVCSIIVAILLYSIVGYMMNKRLNNGRMIGVAFSVIGVVLGLISIVVCLINGGVLNLLAAFFYLLVVAFNIVWLNLTNKPALYRSLKM